MERRPELVLLLCLFIAYTAGQSAEDRLDNVARQYWQWKLENFPESATTLGVHTYDDRLTEFTEQAYTQRKGKCDDFMTDLADIAEDELTKTTDKETLKVLKEEIGQYITGYQWRNYSHVNTVNFLEGPHRPPTWISNMKYENMEDYQKYLTRMSRYAIQVTRLQ